MARLIRQEGLHISLLSGSYEEMVLDRRLTKIFWPLAGKLCVISHFLIM